MQTHIFDMSVCRQNPSSCHLEVKNMLSTWKMKKCREFQHLNLSCVFTICIFINFYTFGHTMVTNITFTEN